MESLGDMLKRSPLGKRRSQIEAKMQELLDQPEVKELLASHPELDHKTLKLNLNKLYQYVKESRACEHCPGLEHCPNDFEGHFTRIDVHEQNGQYYMEDRKVACQKLLHRERQQAVRRRVRSFYVDETALNQGYSAQEILERDYERIGAVTQVMDYIADVNEKGLTSSGLYLSGSFGTGKTFLMSYLLYELARLDYTGVIVYMPEFVEELKSMFQEPAKLRETLETLKETDLLVFDDIGAENMTPWVRDHVLGSILNHRMNRKPTFYTSNYDLSGLLKHFSYTREGEDIYKAERLMDRIKPYVEVVTVNGQNKRGHKNE
ncbi:primosomal protein DnaI [Paenibacillus aquistagni]|uniref:Replicative DNA helicase loader DnaI n=1 Tax=Paenibacillus aquistagni TaxID=1852522 RepID=A0A1X7LTG8_9BACL|nr:primosomal protein DnaI [Paenibacillus aquistagni]NMM51920.1 primosomal protein DnaI [Paenibacillus aquistagni]SMG56794.1 replicative DNA helicase loader DnaI [Paenibacillus aquistagni]